MSAVEERSVFERTVTKKDGRLIIRERSYGGVLDADGMFHLRACCGKYFSFRQEPGGAVKNESEAA